jgi:hypothetical protein
MPAWVARQMTVLQDREQLAQWLAAQWWLEDAYVDEVIPLPSELDQPPQESVRIVFRLQVAGSLIAGETRRMRRLVLDATGISVFSLAAGGFAPGHSCQGANLRNNSGAPLSFVIDVPLDLRLDCSRIDVTECEWDELVPAWFNDAEFSATVRNASLPSPVDWITIFRNHGQLVAWRYWGGPETDPSAVPLDYSGWFLQESARLRATSGGLFFVTAKQHGRDFQLAVRADEAECDALWRTCAGHVSLLPDAEIHCGNVILTSVEWMIHLSSRARAKRGA